MAQKDIENMVKYLESLAAIDDPEEVAKELNTIITLIKESECHRTELGTKRLGSLLAALATFTSSLDGHKIVESRAVAAAILLLSDASAVVKDDPFLRALRKVALEEFTSVLNKKEFDEFLKSTLESLSEALDVKVNIEEQTIGLAHKFGALAGGLLTIDIQTKGNKPEQKGDSLNDYNNPRISK